MKAWEICKKENVGKIYIDDVEKRKWKVGQIEDLNIYDLFDCDYYDTINSFNLRISELAEMNFEEDIDWSKVPVDTKIIISNDNKDWNRRHFAKYENGRVYTWAWGKTSFTANNNEDVTDWEYAKLYNEGEE